MYGIDEYGVYFAKQVPVEDQITVSVVNKEGTKRVQRIFPNTSEGETQGCQWSITTSFEDHLVPLTHLEPKAS